MTFGIYPSLNAQCTDENLNVKREYSLHIGQLWT